MSPGAVKNIYIIRNQIINKSRTVNSIKIKRTGNVMKRVKLLKQTQWNVKILSLLLKKHI